MKADSNIYPVEGGCTLQGDALIEEIAINEVVRYFVLELIKPSHYRHKYYKFLY